MSSDINNTKEADEIPVPSSYDDILELLKRADFTAEQKQAIDGLPWHDDSKKLADIDLAEAAKILDSTHFGLTEIKQKILEFAALQKRNPGFGRVLLLNGKPGVGKTTIAMSIAKALNRPIEKINMASVIAAWELVGSRPGWHNASEGLIMNAVRRAGTFSPVILFDEIDKAPRTTTNHAIPESALLQLFDSQNRRFLDMFLSIPIDLSGALLIATSNDAGLLSDALRDRMEIIHLAAYSTAEKESILRYYIIPELYKFYNINPKEAQLDDSAINALIDNSEGEAGVRLIRKQAEAVFLRAVYMLEKNPDKNLVLNGQDVREIIRSAQPPLKKDILKYEKGTVHTFIKHLDTLELISVEAAASEGLPNLTTTGALSAKKEVKFFESSTQNINDISVAKTALIKSGCVPDEFFANNALHIHFRNVQEHAAVEGVSLAIAAAIFSAANNIVFPDIIFCGEVDLYGNIRVLQGIGDYVEQTVLSGAGSIVIPQHEKVLKADNIKLVAAADLKSLFEELTRDNPAPVKETRIIGFAPTE